MKIDIVDGRVVMTLFPNEYQMLMDAVGEQQERLEHLERLAEAREVSAMWDFMYQAKQNGGLVK